MGTASGDSHPRAHRAGFDISDSPTVYFLAPLRAVGSRSLNLIIGKEFGELVRRVLGKGKEY